MINFAPEYNKHPIHKSLGVFDTSIDAWGKVKVSQDYSVFSSTFTFNIDESQWILPTSAIGNGTTTTINGELHITSGDVEGNLNAFKSRRHPKYQSNRGHLYSSSIILRDIREGNIRRWGLFTEENGVFFELSGETLYAVVRTYYNSEVLEDRYEIPKERLKNIDLSKGNLYDFHFQWRGVGNYRFFINLEEVLVINYVGTLDRLSMSNPAVPPRFEAINLGTSCEIICGCIDVTSEGGKLPRLRFGSVASQVAKTASRNTPIIALYINNTFNGLHNTRDIRLVRAALSSDRKGVVKIYTTRDATAITGATWIDKGPYSYDTSATSINVSKMQLLSTRVVDANTTVVVEGYADYIEYVMTHGDYVVITCEAPTASCYGVFEFGEEI